MAFALLGTAGAVSLPWLAFDSDPLHTKDPTIEAVRTLYDLIGDPVTNPYTIEVLTGSTADAAELAGRLRAVPLVQDARTLRSLVPKRQAEKLVLISDAAMLLWPALVVQPTGPRSDAAALRQTVQAAAASKGVAGQVPSGNTLAAVTADLGMLARASDRNLVAADAALTRFLPLQLARLREALMAEPVTEADIPPRIAGDWLLPDGRAKVQVIPKREAQDSAGLHRFVEQVQAVAPDASGSVVAIAASADTIVGAFRAAPIGALIAITVILAIALQRVLDVALVLAPLLLSTLLTVLAAVLLPLPLNFANIIALPLWLGVGVSFNIYFVMNWRAGFTRPFGSATAREVLFSALTTATAFGSLALSRHPGTASMGALLLRSLECILLVTLLFVRGLLAQVPLT